MTGSDALRVGPAGGGGDRGQPLTVKRVLAMLVLPASLLPVALLGPGELNAPRRLGRQAWAAAVRFERTLQPGRQRPARPSHRAAVVSLGKVYGTWRRFPQVGHDGLLPARGPMP